MQDGPRELVVRLLGPPEVLADGAPLTIERRKALALLAYLAVEPGDHPRDVLAALLAPDDEPGSARAGMRRALAELAPHLRPWLRASAERVGLARDDGLRVDVAEVRALRAAGRPDTPAGRAALRAAADRHRGDFMSGFSLRGSATFEEWQLQQAEQLRGELADTLDLLTRPEAAADDPERAIADARRWLALDPLHEPAHRRLMQLYAAAGQPAAALRQYRALAATLARELGAEPDETSVALYEQIRRGDRGPQASRWTSAPPRLPSAADAAAIAAPALPFLGREAELAAVAAALADPACRILSLVGPGGMGKTRLALHAAAQHRAAFPDGVWQVSLVGVSAPERVLTAIVAALGVGGSGDPLELAVAALQDRAALLLLDNLDQALDAAPLLGALVRRTRRLTLLVTARERLRLQEEWVVDVAGLAVPASAGDPDAASYSAVELFAQRARQVRADFALAPEVLPDVVAICRLVDGMPLAIELAAAWVRVLTPAEIARDLEQSMALLTTTLRDVPERHRSVEGVLAQTWERLSPSERQGLARLSVFDDGFTRAGATEVAGTTPVLLAGLADRALVRRDRTGRYAIHDLLRQFAGRMLAQDPADERATMLRFCRFCMRLLSERAADMQGAHQRPALAELEVEYDNLWTAWGWAVAERRLPELELGLEGMYRLHELRGWYADGIETLALLTTALERDGAAGPEEPERTLLLARARARLGALLGWVGQFAAAERALAAALPVLEAHGAALDAAFALTGLGYVASERDDAERARTLLQAGLATYRALDNQPGVAVALDALGDLEASVGAYDRARDLLEQSSTILSRLGDQGGAAWSLVSLGRVLGLAGDPAAARQLLEESLALFESLGDQHGVSTASANLAELALHAGDMPEARARWLAALRLAREVGAVPLVIDALVGVALVLADEGAPELAHEVAALALEHPASWKETVAAAHALLESTAAALGPAAEQAARRGRAGTWEELAERLLGRLAPP